jgi:hypothetical protein
MAVMAYLGKEVVNRMDPRKGTGLRKPVNDGHVNSSGPGLAFPKGAATEKFLGFI